MRRWLFIFLFMISLVLGIGIAVFLFVDRESTTSRELSLTVPGSNGHDHVFGIYLTQGYFLCGIMRTDDPVGWQFRFTVDHDESVGFNCLVVATEHMRQLPAWGGFSAASRTNRPKGEVFRSVYVVMAPAWLAVALFALPAIGFTILGVRKWIRRFASRWSAQSRRVS